MWPDTRFPGPRLKNLSAISGPCLEFSALYKSYIFRSPIQILTPTDRAYLKLTFIVKLSDLRVHAWTCCDKQVERNLKMINMSASMPICY